MNKSFIEVQFPVSKISKESYKERKANLGQTLTGLGKWWGRKPLILVRATILGMLLPATNNPERDREIFLKILSMDNDGIWQRKNKSITVQELYSIASESEKNEYLEISNEKAKWQVGISNASKLEIQKELFFKLNYDKKITYCVRPEEIENLSIESWDEINKYLGTTATSIQDLFQQLSVQKYGEVITVGDCFCGGGSIPFEAARIGLNSYGSDLNPIATLLTWSALNINGADDNTIVQLRKFQRKVYDVVDAQIMEWGIETNEQGWRANSYLYCNESVCPACGWKIPLAPSWVIGKGTKTIAKLVPKEQDKNYLIEVISEGSTQDVKLVDAQITIKDGAMRCLHCQTITPISSLRKDKRDSDGNSQFGLRLWEKNEFTPRSTDVFQERLYCIRYEETKSVNGKVKTIRHYVTPSEFDFEREIKAQELLKERFSNWQNSGYIPSDKIEVGDKTVEPIRNRGWQYWHQLYNTRQLLINGMLLEQVVRLSKSKVERVVGLLGINKCADWSSKLSIWLSAWDKTTNTFTNQALNTLFNYGTRSLIGLDRSWFFDFNSQETSPKLNTIEQIDARKLLKNSHFWITDPPYADAVNYHELSEYFLAWDKKLLKEAFPEWYTESKRSDAVKGNDQAFTKSMIEVYKNLASHMPEDGMQVVMFTHQDPSVWAELTLILWSAGLQVISAWNIATETESGGLKSGNYVKGTVLLVLKKNTSAENGWLDDIYPQIKAEVKTQIDSMQNLDDKDDPDFMDNDYLLASYAASLKVLTKYKKIGDIDIDYEIAKKRDKKTKSPIQEIIESAIKVAYEYLIPKGISKNLWKDLTKEEKFYIKGIDFEKNGVLAQSAYQELARGLGVSDYMTLLASSKANDARVKTPEDFSNKHINASEVFSNGIVRNILMAIFLSIKDEDAIKGKNWLKNEVADYWNNRSKIVELLRYIRGLETVSNTNHWNKSAQYAGYLQSLVENDGL